MRKSKALLLIALFLFTALLVRIDRLFFKQNSSFCARFLFTCLPNETQWDLPSPAEAELAQLDEVLAQKFHYLGKGAHCYAFVSEDQNYVIKFHRYASHMRIFPWLNHPFAYKFDPKRIKIKEYNLQKLQYNLQNYKNSYLDLKEETGLIFLHINRTDYLKRFVTLVDKTQAQYSIPLDKVTFILQRKADLIYPTLDELYQNNRLEEGKEIVSNIIHLIQHCCEKGYVDEDPVLRKNYGLLGTKAIHIDIGDLVHKPEIAQRENYIPHVKEMTESLRKRLETQYPELLQHYHNEINAL